MIVDNADDFEIFYYSGNEDSRSSILSEYLPFSTLGAILFTTRDREAARRYAGSKVIEIDKMDDKESRELLQGSLHNKQLINDNVSTTKILELLVNLPLAIMQAAAYLYVNDITTAEYLRIYEESSDNFIKLLSKDFEDTTRYTEMKNPVATTWLISFKRIQARNPLAAGYMAFMSCIKEQNIPRDLLPPASELERTEALGTLKAFGFIKNRIGGTSYDMHRLVHTAMQNWLKLQDEWRSWNQKTLNQITSVFPWPHYGNKTIWMIYLPHAHCITTTFNDPLSRTKETEELLGRLLHNLGTCSQFQGKYAEAEVLYRESLQLREKVLGPEHPDTLASINNLAGSLYQQRRFAEAEAIDRQTLQLKEKILGPEHPDTLMSMNNFANLLYQQGRFAEAEAIYRRTLQLKKKILGPEHPDTLMSTNNLALSLQQQGKYAEAEAIHQRAGFKSHPDDRLHTTARKTKRKAEHRETWGPRRSRRIKESRAGC
jgi:tetratricopeptide (TPR) repeat protein